MEILSLIYVFLILGIPISLLSYVGFKNSSLITIEKTKNPIYSERIAAQVGKLKISGPLGRVSIYDDFIVVRGIKSKVIKRNDIECIVFNKSFLNRAIEIKLKNNEVISVWSTDNKMLLKLLQSNK